MPSGSVRAEEGQVSHRSLFARPDVRLVAISTAVFDRATSIRPAHNFRLGDSLHLASAVESACGRFLTNDARVCGGGDALLRGHVGPDTLAKCYKGGRSSRRAQISSRPY